jgi:hypothetical protein
MVLILWWFQAPPAFDQNAVFRALSVPTMMAVGVARPSAQGTRLPGWI